MLTLIFNKEAQVQTQVQECYVAIYFGSNETPQKKVSNLMHLMKDATLTDVTCIEELLNKLITLDVFENAVFALLWK